MSGEIHVRIDRLVLRGFQDLDRAAVGAAVRAELEKLLAEGSVPSGLGSVTRISNLDGGRFEMAPTPNGEAIGGQVAKSLYRGLKR